MSIKIEKMRVALFIPSLAGGGTEKVFVNIANGLVQKGIEIDMVLLKFEGPYKELLSKEINIFELLVPKRKFKKYVKYKLSTLLYPGILLKKIKFTFFYLSGKIRGNKSLIYWAKDNLLGLELVKYIKRRKPHTILSAMLRYNIISVFAKENMSHPPKTIISEHMTNSISLRKSHNRDLWLGLISQVYPKSDLIIAVSQGVADDLSKLLKVKPEKIKVIYNPIFCSDILDKAEEVVAHPFFKSGVPIILSAGRLHPQKDYPTLLKAFSIVCKKRDARLIILGEGRERQKLEKLTVSLNIQDKVDMPGFVLNPYPYMKNASVFVLSSIHEGLSNVLIEALSCGCPVVSTDCQSGPREILDNGRYGGLVSVGDYEGMAEAILDVIESPPPPQFLIDRATEFSFDKGIEKYLGVLER